MAGSKQKQDGRPTVAIVGGGASGCVMAAQLLRRARSPLRVVIVEPHELGQGVAYSTRVGAHLLNVPAGKMSALPDQPGHFLDWLRREILPAASEHDFVSRGFYARYINWLLRESVQTAADGVEFQWLRDRASGAVAGAGFDLTLEGGERLHAAALVLALGNPPPSDPVDTAGNIEIPWAWSPGALSAIAPQAPVLLIGSGLTAIDMILALQEAGHRGTIHLLSRRGVLPRVHRRVAPVPDYWSEAATAGTVRALLRLVRRQARAAQASGSDWRAVIDVLRPHTNDLWRRLGLEERKRFLRHLRSYWEVHRHRMPQAVAATVNRLLAEDRVVLHAGRLRAVAAGPHGPVAQIHLRRGGTLELQVQRLINCAGSECDYLKIDQPLVRSLLEQGRVRTDPLHLGLLVDDTGGLVAADGRSSPRLSALGSVCKGSLWETTAMPEISEQASRLAALLLKDLALA